MKTALTNKQKEIYDFLRDVHRKGEPAPSISEISRHFGFRSSRSARDHLKALERKGLIRRDANKARSIRVLRRILRRLGGTDSRDPSAGRLDASAL